MEEIVRENDCIYIKKIKTKNVEQWYLARSKFSKVEYAGGTNVDELEEFFTKRMIEMGFVPKEKKQKPIKKAKPKKIVIDERQLSLF